MSKHIALVDTQTLVFKYSCFDWYIFCKLYYNGSILF